MNRRIARLTQANFSGSVRLRKFASQHLDTLFVASNGLKILNGLGINLGKVYNFEGGDRGYSLAIIPIDDRSQMTKKFQGVFELVADPSVSEDEKGLRIRVTKAEDHFGRNMLGNNTKRKKPCVASGEFILIKEDNSTIFFKVEWNKILQIGGRLTQATKGRHTAARKAFTAEVLSQAAPRQP